MKTIKKCHDKFNSPKTLPGPICAFLPWFRECASKKVMNANEINRRISQLMPLPISEVLSVFEIGEVTLTERRKKPSTSGQQQKSAKPEKNVWITHGRWGIVPGIKQGLSFIYIWAFFAFGNSRRLFIFVLNIPKLWNNLNAKNFQNRFFITETWF